MNSKIKRVLALSSKSEAVSSRNFLNSKKVELAKL
jgi:hypothetical protein